MDFNFSKIERRKGLTHTPKHILVIRLSAMGDVAMTVPVLQAFTTQYPEVKLTVLTRPFFAPFFRDLKNVSVFSIDLDKTHKGILGLFRLSRTLKKLNIDAVADLHNVLRTNVLKFYFFEKTYKQINKGRKEKKALITGEIFEPLKSTHQRYAEVFERLGFKIELKNPSFAHKKVIPKVILDRLDTQNKKKWIGIAPFAQYQSKMYPLDKMKLVIKGLQDHYNLFLFGGKAEQTQLDALVSSKNTINCAGLFSLDEELDLISNLDLMLSMDSGNAHLAAMLGVKVLTVWGVTHPYTGFGAFNQPNDFHLTPNRADYPKLPTSVYGNQYPEDYKMVSGTITPDTIIDKVNTML